MDINLEEGEIVLCTVDKIVGTTVFVKVNDEIEGTIVTSEIAPGRIRNLRNYVVPGKRIVCKILRISGNRVNLSLRRVKQNEKKEFLEGIKKEKSYSAILKTAVGDNFRDIVNKIKEDYDLIEFFEDAREDAKLLEKFMGKSEAVKVQKILEAKKDKPKEINYVFKLSSHASDGITVVKRIIGDAISGSKCNVNYLAAGKYSIKIIGEDFKEIKTEVNNVMMKLEDLAKKKGCEFGVEKK